MQSPIDRGSKGQSVCSAPSWGTRCHADLLRRQRRRAAKLRRLFCISVVVVYWGGSVDEIGLSF